MDGMYTRDNLLRIKALELAVSSVLSGNVVAVAEKYYEFLAGGNDKK